MSPTRHPAVAPVPSPLLLLLLFCIPLAAGGGPALLAAEVIPPLAQLKRDRPRLLLRPRATPHAVSLAQLRARPLDGDAESARMLRQLQGLDNAAAQAMVWLMTGDAAAADKAIRRMRAYRYGGKADTFHYYFTLTEFALAYDWLGDCPAFDARAKAEVRAGVLPMARDAAKAADDHVFHNYIWMSAGGLALWTLATAGDGDPACDELFERVRQRFNRGLFPAWRYLDGLPSEPMGYWALYVFTPGLWTVLAAQSASETDVIGAIRRDEGAWLDRHFENLVHSTLPDLRYIPWGDLQGGPNGGVTHDMACVIDAGTWALRSKAGARFGQWLREKRGPARYRAETAVFHLIYARRLQESPVAGAAWPAISFLAGGRASAHFIARSGWDDDSTVVAFRCADHFGDHHHYDQGSFLIYRRGLLAVDPPVYPRVRGPQQRTEHHNALLIGGKPQRPVRGQWFLTVEDFRRNLDAGRKLETGDLLFHRDAGPWAAAAGQYAQAYDCPELRSCVRQLLFVRPGTVVVVDRLDAHAGKALPEVAWLLQLPEEPRHEAGGALVATNGRSWIRCRPLLPGQVKPAVEATPVKTHRATFTYPAGGASKSLVHILEVGDGREPAAAQQAMATALAGGAVQVKVAGRTFTFAADADATVTEATAAPATRPAMYFGDTSRLGRPFAKDPSVIRFGGRYLMYYSIPPFDKARAPANTPAAWGIGIAESRDLVNWTPVAQVLPEQPVEAKGICAPCARIIGGKVHLFYQTYGNGRDDAICHAVSDDGLKFIRDPTNPIFKPTGDWNAGRAIDAEVIEHDGRVLLYAATRDPTMKVQMLLVAAADPKDGLGRGAWKQLGDGPILRPELPWEQQCIEAASIFKRDGKLWMFYAGAYNNAPQQVGLAVSEDGVRWKRVSDEPFLPVGPPGSWNSSESGHPCAFVDDDGQLYLFFQGNDDRGRTWLLSHVKVDWRDGKPVLAR